MSDDPSKIKDIDLEIFKDEISECIKPKNDDDIITELCTHCKRLCAASKYYDLLCAAKVDEEKKKEVLVEFMETVYHSVLDDTAHFIEEHEGDLQRVWKEWTERYGFAKCSVSECAKTARHYRRGRRNAKGTQHDENDKDGVYTFYQSLFDRFHNYLAHLYQIGLRVDTGSFVKSEGDQKEDGGSKGVTMDSAFAAERDEVKAKRKECDLALDRLDNENNKFTIDSEEKKTGRTLFDALFDKLIGTEHCDPDDVHRLKEYLVSNHFDSDGLIEDLEKNKESNVAKLLQSSTFVNRMNAIIRSVELRRQAFSTGFVFDYWTVEEPMSITSKFQNLKEEIIESGHLSLEEWMEFVVLKAKRYLKMQKVKKIKSGRAHMHRLHQTNTGHVEDGQPLSLEHLCAIILYCDFGILCTAFSSTYRLENVFEDLESLKKRHSSFGHFGRLLAEAVLDFGINGEEETNGYERGPFFCGINCQLNFGTYAIRLLGPCSTSTQRSVALNFSKGKGIILRLNNDGNESRNQCFFDCSWISNYFEESERLWIAGKKPLKIESITIVKSAKNFKKMIHALYAFDAMISGVNMYNEKLQLSEYDFKLISKLFALRLNDGVSEMSELDPYLVNEWDLFCQSKEELRLDLYCVWKVFKMMCKLILFNVTITDSLKGMDNVLKAEWISLFPSVHTVRIRTQGSGYKFRLEALLETMKSLSRSVTVIVEEENRWAKKALTDKVSTAFNAEGWNMEYVDEHVGFQYGYKGGLIIKSKE